MTQLYFCRLEESLLDYIGRSNLYYLWEAERGLAEFYALSYSYFGGGFETVEAAETLKADVVTLGYLAEAVSTLDGVISGTVR